MFGLPGSTLLHVAEQQKGQHLALCAGCRLRVGGSCTGRGDIPFGKHLIALSGESSHVQAEMAGTEIRARLKGAQISSTADPQPGLGGNREAFLSTRNS